MQTAMKS